MKLLAWIAVIVTGCATAAPDSAPIVTEFPDSRATTTIVPGGHHTELVAGDHVLAMLDWDDATRSATISMRGESRPLLVDAELATPARAGTLAHAAVSAEVDKDAPQGAWEDWCVFCSYDDYGVLYCYFVPFCCGWPYDTCRAADPAAPHLGPGVVAP